MPNDPQPDDNGPSLWWLRQPAGPLQLTVHPYAPPDTQPNDPVATNPVVGASAPATQPDNASYPDDWIPTSDDASSNAQRAPRVQVADPIARASAVAFPIGSSGTAASMPTVLEAAVQGLGSATRQVAQTAQSLSDSLPAAIDEGPVAQPIHWSDLASPWSQLAPKVAYRFAQSYPTVAGGVAGTAIGGEFGSFGGPVGAAAGALGGGAIGAGLASAVQTLGPAFAAELQKTLDDPESAWQRALTQAEISGAFSSASWAAFPVRVFQGPVKQLLFQAFGVQPAISVTQRAVENIANGRPVDEGLGEAYGNSVADTLALAAAHKAIFSPRGAQSNPNQATGAAPQPSTPLINAGGGELPPEAGLTRLPRSYVDDNKRAAGRGVWDLPDTKRGRVIETELGHNLHPNYPTIDVWDAQSGAAASIKSIDIEARSYQTVGRYRNKLYDTLSGYVSDLAQFEGTRHGEFRIRKDEIRSRTLIVAIPSPGAPAQQEVMRRIISNGTATRCDGSIQDPSVTP